MPCALTRIDIWLYENPASRTLNCDIHIATLFVVTLNIKHFSRSIQLLLCFLAQKAVFCCSFLLFLYLEENWKFEICEKAKKIWRKKWAPSKDLGSKSGKFGKFAFCDKKRRENLISVGCRALERNETKKIYLLLVLKLFTKFNLIGKGLLAMSNDLFPWKIW